MVELSDIGFQESYALGFGSGVGVIGLVGLLYYVYRRQTNSTSVQPAPKFATQMYDTDQGYLGGRRKTRKSTSANRKTRRR